MGFLSSLFNAIGGAGSSIMSGLGSIAKPVMSMFSGGGGASNLFGNLFGGGGSQSGGFQPQQGFPGMPPGMSSIAKSMPTSPGQMSMGTPFQQQEPEKKKSWLDSIFPGGAAQGIAGLAIPALGNMFSPKKPSVPDFNTLPNVQAFQNFKPGQSVSPEYQQMVQNNVGRLRDKRVQDLQQVYRSARPGTDYLSDTNYQRDLAEIERRVQEQMTDDLSRAEGTFSAQEQERLSQLANQDILQIMMQTGLEADEANDFKEMFGNAGRVLLNSAFQTGA